MISIFMVYIKDYNKIKEKNWGGSYRQAFELELECYKRISGKENFPTLIDYDTKNMILEIEDVGIELSSYLKNKKRFYKKSQSDFLEIKFNFVNLDSQIKNIIETLRNCNIVHLDHNKRAKNICYKEGKITLIDFNMAVVDRHPINNYLSKLYQIFINEGGYENQIRNLKQNLNKF